jgi:hypothetical protein
MGSFTDQYENKALDACFGGAHSADFPATVYVGLFTVMPDDDTMGTECTGGSYARVALTNNDTNWPDAVGGQKSNGIAVVFPTLTATWGTIVGWGIFDHITDALITDLICYDDLASGQTPIVGDTPEFPIGGLVIEAD